MEKTLQLRFETPNFAERLRGMLGVDFYRLFHTPMFYIFLCIAAFIPAIILGTGGKDGQTAMYTNTWQMIAAESPLYVVNNIGEYANMNMVFIFGGIMVSVFIGHDYRSGYVKQLFTTHAKKRDYMMSKSIVGAFSMACMCGTYLLAAVAAGLFTGADFTVNVGSLIFALLGKVVMSLGWGSFYTFLNVILRRHFWISIAASFFFGTGILVIGAAAAADSSAFLNIFLYGSSVYACLGSNAFTPLVCLSVSVWWAVVYNLLGSFLLSKSDVY